jgi:hypothetical protein
MSNGVRHALGVVAGILLPPLLAAGLLYGVGEVMLTIRQFVMPWAGLAVVAACGVVLAFLVSSRVSPVASLMGGLMFTGLGVLPLLDVLRVFSPPGNLFSGNIGTAYLTLGYEGIFLLLGVLMLVASAFPSRWRSARPPVITPGHGPGAAPPYGQHGWASGPAPYRSPGDEDVTRPMHRE